MSNNNKHFFELVRAGLWEKKARLSSFGKVDFEDVMRLAERQTVVGLVAAGLEHVVDTKIPQEIALQLIGQALQLEQRNAALNAFITELIESMRRADIYTLLVKGQGVAQCYERPKWRASGDVDLLLSKDNFERARKFLLQISSGNKPECNYSKELGYFIDSWSVELHGTQRTGLSERIDNTTDDVLKDVFYRGNVRSWQNGKTTVFLPSANNDVIFVFTHVLKHFYKGGGTNLRQICDWCRLLWKYKDSIDVKLLEKRLHRAGVMSEWHCFAAVAVDYLGMPVEAMPLYNADKKWRKKAEKIVAFILNGREWRKIQDTFTVGRIFPLNTLRFAPGILLNMNWLKVKERLFGE